MATLYIVEATVQSHTIPSGVVVAVMVAVMVVQSCHSRVRDAEFNLPTPTGQNGR